MSLGDLSIAQSQIAKERETLATMVEKPSLEIPEVYTSAFITERKSMLAPRGKGFLTLEKPALLLKKNSTPQFIAVSAEFVRSADVSEVTKIYSQIVGTDSETMPKFILNFIKNYKKGKSSRKDSIKVSLSNIDTHSGFAIFEKSLKAQKPIIATQLKSVGDDDQIIFIPITGPNGR
jgi:hypothetical protein